MALQYVLPLLAFGIAILHKEATVSKRDLALIAGFGSLVAIHSLFYSDSSFLNPALGLLTYSSVLILTLRFKRPGRVFSTIVIVVAILSIFESALGVLQLYAKYGTLVFPVQGAGDNVTGTLANNARVFFMKMLIQSIFLYYVWLDRHSLLPGDVSKDSIVLTGAVSGLLGSVMTGTVAVIALGIGALLIWHIGSAAIGLARDEKRKMRDLMAISAYCLIGLVAFAATQPQNMEKFLEYITGETMITQLSTPSNSPGNKEEPQSALSQPDSPTRLVRGHGQIGPVVLGSQKIGVFLESIKEVLLDTPQNALIGVGLGRYSSRAAMMLTGGYLMPHAPGGQPDWIPVSRSKLTENYIYSRWLMRWRIRPHPSSSLHDPYSSAQSVLIEFGLVGTAAVGAYVIWVMKRSAEQSGQSAIGALLAARLPPLLFVVAISSFYELWLEWPQMIGLLYLLIALQLSSQSKHSLRSEATG